MVDKYLKYKNINTSIIKNYNNEYCIAYNNIFIKNNIFNDKNIIKERKITENDINLLKENRANQNSNFENKDIDIDKIDDIMKQIHSNTNTTNIDNENNIENSLEKLIKERDDFIKKTESERQMNIISNN